MELFSVLTCPACGRTERLEMPTNACVYFHECVGCHVRLRPEAGDCCVFCSYGSVPCPPVQAGNAACCGPTAADSPSAGQFVEAPETPDSA